MNCDEIRENLSAYLDDELSSEPRNAVRDHLRNCPDCSLYHEELKDLQRDLTSLLKPRSNTSGEFTRILLDEARDEFKEDADGPGGTVRDGNLVLTVVTLVVGLICGTYLGIGFVNTIQERSTQRVEINRTATSQIAESDLNEAGSAVSFTDAYFELADARTPGTEP